jgi:hypothetical protein
MKTLQRQMIYEQYVDDTVKINIRMATFTYFVNNHEVNRPFIPPLPGYKGRQYLCKDSDGKWYYLNHARTWQACPPPT